MISPEYIRTGDVLICKGKSSLSKIIGKATGSEFTHTAQAIRINHILYIIDAQKEGILPRKYKFWQAEFDYDFEVFRNPYPVNEKQYVNNAMQYCGVNYDFSGLFHGLFKSVFKAKNMDEKYRNNGKFWCSEYTMKLIGIENSEDFTPKMVRDYLIENKYLLV